MKLPSFKNKPKRMYVFLGLHLFFVSLIIVSSALPREASHWINETTSHTMNTIINFLKGVKQVYPEEIEIGEHTRNIYDYCFDDGKYHIKTGETATFEIKETFKDGADESLKFKKLNIRTNDDDKAFEVSQDTNKGCLYITGYKAHKDNYVSLGIPNTDKFVTINFDIEDGYVPKQENICVSNLNPKIGSSFNISSLFLECYQDKILEDGYVIDESLKDNVYGGAYYTNKNNEFYFNTLSELNSRKYLNLSTHEYISDDPNIYIDKECSIVKINEGTTPGLHKITTPFGGEVEFNVLNEHASDININSLSIKSVKDDVCPGQTSLGYVGQTITLNDEEVLKEHALAVKNNDTSIYYATIKKSVRDGLYSANNEIFIRGNKAGSSNLTVYLYDNPDINLDYQVRCDTMENLYNYRFEIYVNHELINNVEIKNNVKYLLEVKLHYLDDDRYEEVNGLDISRYDTIYKLSYEGDNMYVTFISPGSSYMVMFYKYNDATIRYRVDFKVIDSVEIKLADVDPKAIRKSIGHAMIHLLSTLFLVLFLSLYLEGKNNKWIAIIIAAITSLLLAGLSELIQYFVPGRCFTLLDILIDYAGSTLALLVLSIIFLVQIKKHKNKENNTDEASLSE